MTSKSEANRTQLRRLLAETIPAQSLSPTLQETLVEHAQFMSISPEEILFQQGERSDKIYFTMSGQFAVLASSTAGQEQKVHEVLERTWLGETQVLFDSQATATVRAQTTALLAYWTRTLLSTWMQEQSSLLDYFTSMVRQRLYANKLTLTLISHFPMFDPMLLEELKSTASWRHLKYGEPLVRQGDPGDSLYLVIQGRLGIIKETPGQAAQLIGERGQGSIIGEFAMFDDGIRSASIYALQNSSVVAYTREVFERLQQQHPHLLFAMFRQLIQRIKTDAETLQPRPPKTVAVIPLDTRLPIHSFCHRLQESLGFLGDTTLLSSTTCEQSLGVRVKEGAQVPSQSSALLYEIHIQHWLETQELKHAFVLYQADPTLTDWTRHCLRQAESILLLASPEHSPVLSEVEEELAKMGLPWFHKPQELVLLHPQDCVMPSGTRVWLKERDVLRHHHVRWHDEADVSRIARFLTHRAIGVVLGGGGARGISHFGGLMALRDAGIPIDIIGGTSMGAGIALQYAKGVHAEESRERIRRFMRKNNPFGSRTLPLHALYDGTILDEYLQEDFGPLQLEDMWLNCFCTSCDLTNSKQVVHRTGTAWEAIRASMAAPGLLRPMVQDGHLLVDGGVLDNLPGKLMKSMNPGPLLVFDVGGQAVPPTSLTYQNWPSPWKMVARWFNPFAKAPKVPTIVEVMVQSMLTHSISRRQHDIAAADLYFRPPIEAFSIFDFHKFDDILECGYQHTSQLLAAWQFDPKTQRLSQTLE